jgi:hypothetical protein
MLEQFPATSENAVIRVVLHAKQIEQLPTSFAEL